MELYERILTKEEINRRFIMAVTAIMTNGLISSKTGLAESLGVKPAKFSEILNGRMNAGIDMIARMCDFYGISPDWLLLSRGNNVFRRMAKQKIWVDDDDLNTEYTEVEMPGNKITEETKWSSTPIAMPVSPIDESFIYKMYKEEKAEKESKVEDLTSKMLQMAEEIGNLKAKLSQYEPETEGFNEKAKGLGHAKTVSIGKPSSLNVDNATSAAAQ